MRIDKRSTEDVVNLARRVGLRNDLADVLRKQEIEGSSLLTLTKEELMKVGLPLGPAASLTMAIAALKQARPAVISTYGILPLLISYTYHRV